MSGAIDWKHLQEQLLSETVYREEIAKMLELDDTDVRKHKFYSYEI